MASSSTPSNNMSSPPSSPDTIYVEVELSDFQAVVQSLTGLPEPETGNPNPEKSAFKPYEGQSSKATNVTGNASDPKDTTVESPKSSVVVNGENAMSENVAVGQGSTNTPVLEEEKERWIVVEDPRPLDTQRGSDPPVLLPLFPVNPPTHEDD